MKDRKGKIIWGFFLPFINFMFSCPCSRSTFSKCNL